MTRSKTEFRKSNEHTLEFHSLAVSHIRLTVVQLQKTLSD
jgi:hypothetical protein